MPKEFGRTQRVAQLIQRELSVLIREQMQDPRISPMLSISAVTVSRDLNYAKIYVMLPGDDDVIQGNVKSLNKAAGFFRSHLAKAIKLRKMPELKFVYDSSLAYGNHMSALLDAL